MRLIVNWIINPTSSLSEMYGKGCSCKTEMRKKETGEGEGDKERKKVNDSSFSILHKAFTSKALFNLIPVSCAGKTFAVNLTEADLQVCDEGSHDGLNREYASVLGNLLLSYPIKKV